MSKEERGQSDLAKLLRQFDEEFKAAQQGLQGLAQGTSQHDFITKRMEGMETARKEIEEIIGPEEATRLIVEQMNRKERQSE